MTLVSMFFKETMKLLSYMIYLVRTPKVDSAGFIMAGKNDGGLKYGGIAEKPPNLTRHN